MVKPRMSQSETLKTIGRPLGGQRPPISARRRFPPGTCDRCSAASSIAQSCGSAVRRTRQIAAPNVPQAHPNLRARGTSRGACGETGSGTAEGNAQPSNDIESAAHEPRNRPGATIGLTESLWSRRRTSRAS